jgi:membrane-bound lytic murein transglycosylase A
MYIGYSGNNGHEYTGLGATLISEGVIEPERLSLASIRQHFAGQPDELERYIQMNDRYVFFANYDGTNWPAGSLGTQVTPEVSLATDKTVFPRGGIVVINTTKTPLNAAPAPLNRFMLDQDTGGAIRAAGRADIYYGVGPGAEQNAGGQFAEGRMYYFFLKHGKTLEWHHRMLEEKPPTKTSPVKPISQSKEVY